MSEIDKRDCQHGLADTQQDEIGTLRQRVKELEPQAIKGAEIMADNIALVRELAALKQAQDSPNYSLGEPVGYIDHIGIAYPQARITADIPIGTKLYTAAPTIRAGWQPMDMDWLRQMLHVNALRAFPEKSHEAIALEIERVLAAAPKQGGGQ